MSRLIPAQHAERGAFCQPVLIRTNCCQDRLEGAQIYVSASDPTTSGGFQMFGGQGGAPQLCGTLTDHSHAPEVSQCLGKVGRYITVVHESLGNPSGGGQVRRARHPCRAMYTPPLPCDNRATTAVR